MWRPVNTILSYFILICIPICFGQQVTSNSDAAKIGLLGSVRSVLSNTFGPDGSEREDSELIVYDPHGYEVEMYFYVRNVLRSHAIYTRSHGRLVKVSTKNPLSKETIVQLLNPDGAVAATETYNGSGHLVERKDNYALKQSGRITFAKQADGTSSTIERFPDGSFNERTVRPDGTTIVHMHGHAALQPPLFLFRSDTDTYQTFDGNSRVLESLEESQAGFRKSIFRYDAMGRETESRTYSSSGQLLNETTIEYSQEDENRNWTEQVWIARTDGKPAKRQQVTYRTITYYETPH